VTPVVLLGDLPGIGMTRGPLAQRIPIDGFSGGVAGAYALAQELAPYKAMPIIALFPSWQEEKASALPPLALSLVADQLAALSEELAPGVLAGLAPKLAESVVAGAWVGSVAKFEHVPTGRRATVRSFLPGAGFLVTLEPVVGVHRITAAEPVVSWPSRPLDPVWLVSAQQNGDTAWLEQHLIPSLAAQPAGLLPPQPMSPGFWGTDKYTEFVAWSGHPQAIQVLTDTLNCRTCDWCGELAALPVCSFCEMAQPPQPPQPVEPARPEPPPAPAPSEFWVIPEALTALRRQTAQQAVPQTAPQAVPQRQAALGQSPAWQGNPVPTEKPGIPVPQGQPALEGSPAWQGNPVLVEKSGVAVPQGQPAVRESPTLVEKPRVPVPQGQAAPGESPVLVEKPRAPVSQEQTAPSESPVPLEKPGVPVPQGQAVPGERAEESVPQVQDAVEESSGKPEVPVVPPSFGGPGREVQPKAFEWFAD
jgi:hypothetical protein